MLTAIIFCVQKITYHPPIWHLQLIRVGVLVMILLFSHICILIRKYHVLSMYYDETVHK